MLGTLCEQKGIDMERFLLFDAGCVLCSQLAHSIERESNGWLSVHSLREPAMQSLLDRANVPQQWKPTLIEVDGKDIRVFTGLRLELQLLIGLGPQKAWRIAQMAYEINSSLRSNKIDVGRRSFFTRSGAVLAGIALGLGLGNSVFNQNAHAESLSAEAHTFTSINPSDAVIGQLRQMGVVQRANAHFGVPNWQEVQKVEDRLTHESVYMIPYVSQKSSLVVKATFLAVVASSLQGVEKGVVGQMIHVDAQKQEFVWLTPDAYHIVTTTGHKDGHADISTQDIHSLGVKEAVQPHGFITCLSACLAGYHLSSFCDNICISCYLSASPVGCLFCATCSAGAYAICVARCTSG